MRVSHEGLLQTLSTQYHLSPDGSRQPGTTVQCTIRLSLPWNLVPAVWSRHGYSWTDIEATLKEQDPRTLWLFALLLGITIQPTAVRPSFGSRTTITYMGNAIAREKIKAVLLERYGPFAAGSVLLGGIPVHVVPKALFDRLRRQTPHEMNYLAKPNKYKGVHKWNHTAWVPVRQEADMLEMMRVYPKSVFESTYRMRKSKYQHPIVIVIGKKRFYAGEESCYFRAPLP